MSNGVLRLNLLDGVKMVDYYPPCSLWFMDNTADCQLFTSIDESTEHVFFFRPRFQEERE